MGNMKMYRFKSLNLNRLDVAPVRDELMPQAIKILVIFVKSFMTSDFTFKQAGGRKRLIEGQE